MNPGASFLGFGFQLPVRGREISELLQVAPAQTPVRNPLPRRSAVSASVRIRVRRRPAAEYISDPGEAQPEAAADQRKAYLKRLRTAQKRVAKLVRRIEERLQDGKVKGALEAQRKLLGSFDAKLLSYDKANKKMPRRKKLLPAALEAAAAALNPFGQEAERVMLRLELKKDKRTHRTIHSFGINHRARQYLCLMALAPFLKPTLREEQFASASGGRDQAVRKLIEGIEGGEINYFAELDINDFYPNLFTHTQSSPGQEPLLDWLPLPKEVTRFSLLPSDFHILSNCSHIPLIGGTSLTIESRAGLSQGSATSPLIAEAVVSSVLSDADAGIPASVQLWNFADNFGIGGKSSKSVKQAMIALERSTERCPRGCFRLKSIPSRHVGSGIEFLGYHLRRRSSGKVDVGVSEKNKASFAAKVHNHLKALRVSSYGRPEEYDRFQSFKNYIRGWCLGFQLAPYVRHTAFRICLQEAGNVSMKASRDVRRVFTDLYGSELIREVVG